MLPLPQDVADSFSDPEQEQEHVSISSTRFASKARRGSALACVAVLAGTAAMCFGVSRRANQGSAQAASVCPDLADCSGYPPGSQAPGSGHLHAGHLHPSSPGDFLTLQEDLPPGAAGVLVRSYHDVFKSGNRNSASHLWSSFLFNQSASKTAADLEDLFTGFCGISGSVVVPISADSRWRLTLKDLAGVEHTGFMYYCTGCMGWPCLCDARENVKIDTKTITLADGLRKQYKFVVIGNPCKNPAMAQQLQQTIDDPAYGEHKVTLQMAAPELKCDGSILQGATLSDNGHIILAMFFEDVPDQKAQREQDFDEVCANRGQGAGMGPIFRTLAGVNPL